MERAGISNRGVGTFFPFLETVITSVTEHIPHVPGAWKMHPKYCPGYFEQEISVVPSVFRYFILLVFVYLLYAKLLQGLLKRMELPEINRDCLVEAMWYAGLCGASIPGCVLKLMMDYKLDSLRNFYNIFINEKLFVSEERVPSHLVFLFILFCALSAHSVWLTWSRDGFNVEFYTRLCFFLFFSSTYSLRCVLLGLACILLVSVSDICAEITRIFCVLNWKRPLRVYSVKLISYIFFTLHCIVWSIAFLYILPARVLRSTATMRVKIPEDIPALILLNAALWGFFWLQLVWAPASVVARQLASNIGRRHRNVLDVALFPSRNALLAELRAVCLRVRQQQEEEAHLMMDSPSSVNPGHLSSGTQMRTLFQTVRCVMAIKRRLRRRREIREGTHSNSTDNSTDSFPVYE